AKSADNTGCLIEHFGNADAVPQLPERCLSRKAGIVRCCLKPLNHPYKARPAGISNFPGRQYCIHSHIFSFFVLVTRTHLLCLSLFPSSSRVLFYTFSQRRRLFCMQIGYFYKGEKNMNKN
ncbi:MAG: hypothetical protein WAY38_06210, partial [Gemmiger qucibialis]